MTKPGQTVGRFAGHHQEVAVESEPGAFFLPTRRLGFRTWREEDLDLAIGLWGDPLVTRLIDARAHGSQ